MLLKFCNYAHPWHFQWNTFTENAYFTLARGGRQLSTSHRNTHTHTNTSRPIYLITNTRADCVCCVSHISHVYQFHAPAHIQIHECSYTFYIIFELNTNATKLKVHSQPFYALWNQIIRAKVDRESVTSSNRIHSANSRYAMGWATMPRLMMSSVW